ncbi:hypothetical protein BACUNI_04371 [Bacteroides uniformis ATCC 8492]|uniref:Uncharacterized protein n=1 Tax=Bacteroides uniformis (strain ATCC 8492 / DSM 6597 / CCUG 4942 / CIP 103695 / JCM 5828 / KCTC 5204 / NCTC 13054 / VPI 0061) TaxID=411479 RepID=A0ABC9N581_BACUC|nr:hypothetical protein BACUNI_04371 [Bacteroides uniformis ATCC 8492]
MRSVCIIFVAFKDNKLIGRKDCFSVKYYKRWIIRTL